MTAWLEKPAWMLSWGWKRHCVRARICQPRMIKAIWPTGKTAVHCAADSLGIILYQHNAYYGKKSEFSLILTHLGILGANSCKRRDALHLLLGLLCAPGGMYITEKWGDRVRSQFKVLEMPQMSHLWQNKIFHQGLSPSHEMHGHLRLHLPPSLSLGTYVWSWWWHYLCLNSTLTFSYMFLPFGGRIMAFTLPSVELHLAWASAVSNVSVHLSACQRLPHAKLLPPWAAQGGSTGAGGCIEAFGGAVFV